MSLFPNTQERIATQQAQADVILDKLFPIDPYVICAGGAPRDWYLGKAANDLDIFIHPSIALPTFKVYEQLKSVGFDVLETKSGEGLPDIYKRNPLLMCVFNVNVNWNGTNVQIMRMLEPTFKSVLPQFPLSICKAWYKNYKIHLDKEFKRSVAHRMIVKTNTVYNDENAYIKKIMDKFPDYKYYSNWELAAAEIMDREVT